MAVTDSPGPGRVLVALAAGPLVAEPTWTRYDTLTDCPLLRLRLLRRAPVGARHDRHRARHRLLPRPGRHARRRRSRGAADHAAALQPRHRGMAHPLARAHRRHRPRPHRCAARRPARRTCRFPASGSSTTSAASRCCPGVFGDAGGPDDVVFYEDERVDDRIIAPCSTMRGSSRRCGSCSPATWTSTRRCTTPMT